jgi:hypothetical protein
MNFAAHSGQSRLGHGHFRKKLSPSEAEGVAEGVRGGRQPRAPLPASRACSSQCGAPAALRKRFRRNGFSLVVTLMMMVLLTVMAVGLLSLSSIALRATTRGNDMAVAKANARLALMMAVGELQKSLGPDQAVTAASDINTSNPAKPNLVGVWQSWDYNPLSSPDYATEKSSRFRKWLVSSGNLTDVDSQSFVDSKWSEETVELYGQGSLGSSATANDKVQAGLVMVDRGDPIQGAYAWHVSDESMKARVNVYRDPGATTLAQKVSLAGGHRPMADRVKGLDGVEASFLPTDETSTKYDNAAQMQYKLITSEQFSILGGAGSFGAYRHSLTPYSQGLLTNVRKGSLKKDLSLALASPSLPKNLSGRIYQSMLSIEDGSSKPYNSDPYWSRLADYHNIYTRGGGMNVKSVSGEAYIIDVYDEGDTKISSIVNPPKSYPVAPVMARLDIYVTAVVRPRCWVNGNGMHINLCPVITLINPYSHRISFKKLKYDFNNVPIGVRLYVGKNNSWYNDRIVPVGKMAGAAKGETDLTHYNSYFTLYLGDWSNHSPISSSNSVKGDITLEPGQSMIFAPYIDPNSSMANNLRYSTKWYKKQLDTFDPNARESRNLKLAPGFRGLYSGDERLNMNPVYAPYTIIAAGDPTNWNTLGYPIHFGTEDTELILQVGIADDPKTVTLRGATGLAPQLGTTPQTKFSLSCSLTTPDGTESVVGGYEYDFADKDKFDDLLNMPKKVVAGKGSKDDNVNRALKYPRPGTQIFAFEMLEGENTLYTNYNNARTFARFTLSAKTTRGGVYETDSRQAQGGAQNVLKDGQLPTKPFLNENFAIPLACVDLANQKRGDFPYEMNLVTYGGNAGEVEDDLEILENNEAPVLTGSTVVNAQKSGALFDLPAGPLTAISDLRRSNVLSSQHPPFTMHPVANSKVPPALSTNQVVRSNASHNLLDHTFLFNHSVYDNFFFSSVADQDGATAKNRWSDFLNRRNPLTARSLQPYLPEGQTLQDAEGVVDGSSTPYDKIAQYLMTQAPFNVNSTNVQAWKAVLSSLAKTNITYYDTAKGSERSELVGGIPLVGQNFPSGKSTDERADLATVDGRTAHWNGYRKLSDVQIEALAGKIVEQVRLRGPFLSFSEFVNRRIGTNSQLTRMGALEAAIENSGLNAGMFANQVNIRATDVTDENNFDYKTPEVLTGNPAEGAPSWVMQGDVMKVLEPGGTVRPDTFVIRVVGQARDSAGVTAQAYAEAVVQRYPEFVDLTDSPDKEYSNLNSLNQKFGRKFRIVAFRWLQRDEI